MVLDKIIVVGAGPSGLLLSLLLAKKGIQVSLLEANAGLDEQPRATHYAPPAIRELRRAGLVDEIREQGLLPNCLTWRDPEGNPIAKLRADDLDHHPDRMLCLPLDKLSRLILSKLTNFPSVTIHWSTKVLGIGQDKTKAWVEAETPEGGTIFEAPYIIGCDGANSQIRRSLFGDQGFPGRTWDQQIVATNVYYDFERFAWDDVNYVMDPEHWYMAAKISEDGMWRVSYGERIGLSVEELRARQPFKFEKMLPGNPKPEQYRLTNFSPYRTHQRCVESMRKDRFILAADAAHLCNPFGGLGLSGGIVDVGNLYDCLAGIHDDLADSSILEKYDEIRRQKYKEIIDVLSTENLKRLFDTKVKSALETDSFFQILIQAENDKDLSRNIQLQMNSLQHDFTQYYNGENSPTFHLE